MSGAFGPAAEAYNSNQPRTDNEVMEATNAEVARGEIATTVTIDENFLVIEDTFVTVALRSEVQDVLRKFMIDREEELTEVLKPFGLAAIDVLIPTFERSVRNGEVSQGQYGPERHRRFV